MWELRLAIHYPGSRALDLSIPVNEELQIPKMDGLLKDEVICGGKRWDSHSKVYTPSQALKDRLAIRS